MITDSECQRRCREAERAALERAAQVADETHAEDGWHPFYKIAGSTIASRIRALIGVPHTGEGTSDCSR